MQERLESFDFFKSPYCLVCLQKMFNRPYMRESGAVDYLQVCKNPLCKAFFSEFREEKYRLLADQRRREMFRSPPVCVDRQTKIIS